jgi:DnaJ-class molecular chaperone
MTDPYKTLGVTPKSTEAEIKKAYRRLAKEYHPDRNDGDKAKEERFKNISAAYQILTDPAKRSQFDNAASGGGIPMDANLSEIFAQMFGGGMGGGVRGQRSQGGRNPFGGMGGSPFGGGMGGMGGSPFGGGMGGMGGMGGSPFGAQPPRQPKAKAKKSPPKERKVKAADGSDLVQKGAKIYSDLRIPFDQAMVGSVAKVPTLTGSAKVTIPAGTSSGQKLRLKGKGAKLSGKAVAKGGTKASHGDHFVTVQIDVPEVEAGEGRDLLSKLVELLEKSKR